MIRTSLGKGTGGTSPPLAVDEPSLSLSLLDLDLLLMIFTADVAYRLYSGTSIPSVNLGVRLRGRKIRWEGTIPECCEASAALFRESVCEVDEGSFLDLERRRVPTRPAMPPWSFFVVPFVAVAAGGVAA